MPTKTKRGRGERAKRPRRPAYAKPAGRYHHGDLRRALLDASLALLEEEGIGPLTLREVARRAGVSHAAPYRHFETKEALLAAIAQEGFHALGARMREAMARAGDDLVERHLASGVAYVRFALQNRGHFEVMFSPAIRKSEHPALSSAARAALTLLVETIAEAQRRGLYRAGDLMELTLHSWSMVHGLAQLAVGDQLGGVGLTDRRRLPRLAEGAVRALVDGLRDR